MALKDIYIKRNNMFRERFCLYHVFHATGAHEHTCPCKISNIGHLARTLVFMCEIHVICLQYAVAIEQLGNLRNNWCFTLRSKIQVYLLTFDILVTIACEAKISKYFVLDHKFSCQKHS